jgi:hypothetical protein
MVNLYYYLGPWQWISSPRPHWQAPTGTVGLVDLGTISDMSMSGTSSTRGMGFFASSTQLDSSYTLLGQGDCRDIVADVAMRSAWRTIIGYNPLGDKLVDLLWDTLTNGADPDGNTSCKPLVPNSDLLLELNLGGSVVKSESFSWGQHPHTDKLRQLIRSEFAILFDLVHNGKMRDDKQHLRILDAWCEKYHVTDWKEFVAPSLQKDVPGRVPHNTIITDNFNRTNADALGTSSEGWTWNEFIGDLDIVSNAVVPQVAGGGQDTAMAESDLSSADHYSQAVITLGASFHYVGVIARKHNTAETYYIGYGESNGSCLVDKVINGVQTFLNSGSGMANGTIKLSANGSSIKFYVNGVEQISFTDTSITGNVRGGIFGYIGSGCTLDDFQAADLGGNAVLGNAPLACITTVNAFGQNNAVGTASLSCIATINASGHKVVMGITPLACIATINAFGQNNAAGTVSLSCIATINAFSVHPNETHIACSTSLYSTGGLITEPFSKTISWGYDVCKLGTYRVLGRDLQQRIVIVNITGCSVEEVCRKLLSRGLVRFIDEIQKYVNVPLFGEVSGSVIELEDVTPTLDNCEDCCYFVSN